MFDGWRKRRKLKKELARVVRLHEAEVRAAKNIGVDLIILKDEDDISSLWWLETADLVRRAQRYGVEPPPRGLVTGHEPFWETNTRTGRTYLTDSGVGKIAHETTEAIFDYWKRWIEIVSPVATVLIALFALAVSILALYLQLKHAPH